MIEVRSPEHLTISELLQEAHQEIQVYLRKQPTVGACAFELFRRAIGQHDEQAWVCLYELCHVAVGSWVLRRLPAVQREDLEPLVNEVFAKCSRSIGPERFKDFSSVGALLASLKCCTGSVLANHCRSQQARPREEPLLSLDQEPVVEDFAGAIADQLAAQEAWAVVSREVQAQEERLIPAMVCVLGWSPAELQHHYLLVFPSIEDMYRRKRNVLERLRRNKKLLQLLDRQSSRKGKEVRRAS